MASKSADHTRLNSARESAPESDDNHQTVEDDILPYEDPEPPLPEENSGPEENAGNVEDEELLEMLEQLSETIDTAHNVIAEQQMLASETAHGEQAAGLELQPPLPATPARWSAFGPALAASLGVFFGIAALAALWLMRNSPVGPGDIELAKDQDRIARTVVSRSLVADEKTPALAAEPVKTTAPLHSRSSTAPAPAPEPVINSEPMTNPQAPAIMVMKDPQETPAVAAEKAPALPPLGTEEETQLLERGQALISSGDVASARLAYEYAARRGSAEAMFALAQTYDLEVLAAWNVVGIEPDTSIALEWYGRAAQNGHDPADARASELEKLSTSQR